MNFAIGISLLGVLYLGAGGMLGSAMYEVAHGRGGELMQEPVLFWFTVFANAIGLPWLWMMWRAQGKERSINFRDERMGFKSLFMRGVPTNKRIVFLVCAAMWIAGFAVSLAFAVPR